MDQSPAFIATEVTLPGSGRVVEVRVSSKWTVDQVKVSVWEENKLGKHTLTSTCMESWKKLKKNVQQHCFKTIPDLQAQRKNDFNVGLSEVSMATRTKH